ncbi:MAG: hypothetical protein AAGL98_00005 [Planctomycetota bacterium]
MPAINILGSFQDPNSFDQGAGKLVNVRVVPRDPKETRTGQVRFAGAPGLATVCRPSPFACIAICHALETIWTGHADGSIYSGVETGTPTLQGFVAVNAAQPVIRFAEDRTALAIASNANVTPDTPAAQNPAVPLAGTGYIATLAAGVANCGFDVSINFDPATVAELDNMSLWSAASNYYANQDAKIFNSNPLAPATVKATAFATKEARGDKVIDLAVSGRILWPLGSRSLEQWYDSGSGADNPFVPYPNSLTSVGLAARLSLAVLRDVIMFVGTDRRIWACTGQTGTQVSPPWVDLLLQQLTLAQLGQLTAYAYGQGGSDFYVLTLPGSWSLELAGSTGVWSYRQSYGRADHAGRCATEHDGGVTYVGLDTGHVCTINADSSLEPGGSLSRIILSPWVGSQEARTTYDAFDTTSSMGPAAGTFQLDWSEDRGVTWRGARQITMPQPGTRRAIGRNFGTGRRRQFRLQYSGTQAPFTIDELFLMTTPGS